MKTLRFPSSGNALGDEGCEHFQILALGNEWDERAAPEKVRSAMRIDFERTGGFAGMRLATTIDTTALPVDQAGALQSLIDDAHFFDLPARIPSPPNVADRFNYRVTIEAEGTRHTVDVGESSASPALQALLQQLTLLARSARSA